MTTLVEAETPEERYAWQSTDLMWNTTGIGKATTPGLSKRSGMVSIDLPAGTVPEHPGGVDDHHLTLAYLGPDVSDEELEAALNLVRAAAPQHESLTVRLGGLGTFLPSESSHGKTPAFVPVEESEKLLRLRGDLADLDRSGRPDWHPHVTLVYLDDGQERPSPVPTTSFQATHVTVHRGDSMWRVPLGEAAAMKAYGLTLSDGFIGKVGPEGYIHGFICVRPPCGKGDHAKVTRDAANGKVYLGEKGTGEYIGKIVKNTDGTYTARHNGHIIGGGKTLLGGKYKTHDQAAVALGHYHSLRALEKSSHDDGNHEIASHLGSAATAHASGDVEQALFNLQQAHGAASGTQFKANLASLHAGMGGKLPQASAHPTSDAELEHALTPSWEQTGIPKPSAPAHPSGHLTPHNITEEKIGTGTYVKDKATGKQIGMYYQSKATGKWNASHNDGTHLNGNANQDEALDALLAYHNDAHGSDLPSSAPLATHEVDFSHADLKVNSTDTGGDIIDTNTGAKLGTYTGSVSGDITATHNDDTMFTGSAGFALSGVVDHHNWVVSQQHQVKPPAKKTTATMPPVKEMTFADMPAASEKKPYETVGKVSDIDVVATYTDKKGVLTHALTGTQLGTYTADNGVIKITHADSTRVPHSAGDSVKTSLTTYHNSKYGDDGAPTVAPKKTATSPLKPADEPTPPADWEKELMGADEPAQIPQKSTAGATWAKAGAVDAKDLSLKVNGDVVHKPTKTVIGHISKQPNTPKAGTTTFTATHADGTKTHTGVYKGNALASIALHHNEQLGKPVNPVAPIVPEAPPGPTPVVHGAPKPWDKAGTHVTHADVTAKTNGDVVHKASKTKIGVLYKSGSGHWTAAHEDGQGFPKYVKKNDALDKLLAYHNQSVAIDKGVDPGSGGSLAVAGKIHTNNFWQVKSDDEGNLTHVDTGASFGKLEPENGGFKATLANGTSFHIPTTDKMKAKYNFLYAHNQAAGIATNSAVDKLTAHPPLPGQSIGFSEHTKVGSVIPSLTTTSPGFSSTAAASASSTVSHIKHSLNGEHTPDEKAAVTKYTGSWYATINTSLASKKLAGDEVPSGSSAASLHHALNKTELAHDATLYRGIHDANAMLGPVGSQVGKVGTQHSFMSTSTKEGVAKGFGHGGVLLTIHAPKGAKAMNVVNVSHYKNEAEVLFQHGTMYKVNSDVIGPDGYRHADITIVGLSSHTGNHTVYNKIEASS